MILTKEQLTELETVSKPLVKFLNEFHPHVQVVVEDDGVKFFEMSVGLSIEEFIKD